MPLDEGLGFGVGMENPMEKHENGTAIIQGFTRMITSFMVLHSLRFRALGLGLRKTRKT